MASFKTGATRTSGDGKFDYEGFLSPLVIDRYAQYMHKHRSTPDGGFRASDNWQLGIPLDAYIKSGWRHFMDWWRQHRGNEGQDTLEESLCALIFNTMGYLHETLKATQESGGLNRYSGLTAATLNAKTATQRVPVDMSPQPLPESEK